MNGARQLLWRDLVMRCHSGEIAMSGRLAGAVEFIEISSQFLEHSEPDCDNDTLTNSGQTVLNILVRESSHVRAAQASGKEWRPAQVEAWFKDRIDKKPPGGLWYSEEEDLLAASLSFPSVSREIIRSLRKQFVPAARMKQGRRPKIR